MGVSSLGILSTIAGLQMVEQSITNFRKIANSESWVGIGLRLSDYTANTAGYIQVESF